jgi:hypothetical protein
VPPRPTAVLRQVELVLIRLAATAESPPAEVHSDLIKSILWARADPVCRPEHIKVNPGLEPRTFDVVIFLLPGDTSPDETVQRIWRSVVESEPVLACWTASLLPSPSGPLEDWDLDG